MPAAAYSVQYDGGSAKHHSSPINDHTAADMKSFDPVPSRSLGIISLSNLIVFVTNWVLQARTEVEARAVELEGDDAEHRRPTEALVKVPALAYQASVTLGE